MPILNLINPAVQLFAEFVEVAAVAFFPGEDILE